MHRKLVNFIGSISDNQYHPVYIVFYIESGILLVDGPWRTIGTTERKGLQSGDISGSNINQSRVL